MVNRKNINIIEMPRSVMEAEGLPNNYWVEAVDIVVYLLNRSPIKALTSWTTYEALYKRNQKLII